VVGTEGLSALSLAARRRSWTLRKAREHDGEDEEDVAERVVFEGSRDKGTGRELERCPSCCEAGLQNEIGTNSGSKSDRRVELLELWLAARCRAFASPRKLSITQSATVGHLGRQGSLLPP
jgi:hypothetical protein